MQKSDVIEYFGGQAATARAMTAAGYRISQVAVCNWGAIVPEMQARRLHEITAGALLFDENVYKTAVTAA